MDIDFSKMAVGDRVAMSPGKWSDTQRAELDAAAQWARKNATEEVSPQFQADGNEGSMTEKGQYWITRIL